MTGHLLDNVSYEKLCHAKQSLNILVDGVADGAGEAARRRPKSSFHHFFRDFGLYSADIAPTRILVRRTATSPSPILASSSR
jgi:hypothetical protein